MTQFFAEAAANFSHLSGVEKAGFAFWSLTTLAFWVCFGIILVMIVQDKLQSLKGHSKK